MKYEKIVTAKFISRPNRFVAKVSIGGQETDVHVKNTGRCRELLLPDAEVYLEDFSYRMGKRKMAYDLVAVKKGELLINMDSQAPNKVAGESLKSGKIILPEMSDLTLIRPETKYGDSRFDFYLEDSEGRKAFLEVKGVTLENDGIASFPDAPTERGVKHVYELVNALKKGYNAYILFVIQMSGMKLFRPNDTTHKAFGDALRFAEKNGVHILAYECHTEADSFEISKSVPINLQEELLWAPLKTS